MTFSSNLFTQFFFAFFYFFTGSSFLILSKDHYKNPGINAPKIIVVKITIIKVEDFTTSADGPDVGKLCISAKAILPLIKPENQTIPSSYLFKVKLLYLKII